MWITLGQKLVVGVLGVAQTIDVVNFAKIVLSERTRRRWSQDKLAAKSGIPKNTIQNIETGKTKRPQGDSLEGLMLAFKYETLDAMIQAHEQPEATRSMGADPYRSDPALGLPVKNKTTAGPARDYQDVGNDQYDHIPITHAAVGDPDAFALQIVGTSMVPRWNDGDYALFAPRAQWTDGDECLIQFNENRKGGEGNTFKRVQNLPGGKLLLIPNNAKDHKTEVVTWASHLDDTGEVVRVVKCVGKYERYDWTPKPLDQAEGYQNQRQDDGDLPVMQNER